MWLIPGCAPLRDALIEDKLFFRSHAEARRLWNIYRQELPPGDEYFADRQRGFHDGYADIAAGKDGCPPTLPNKRYWKEKYRSDEGRLRVIAWYEGYERGVSAAQASRARERTRLVTKFDVYGDGRVNAANSVEGMVPAAVDHAAPGDGRVPSGEIPPVPSAVPDSPPISTVPPSGAMSPAIPRATPAPFDTSQPPAPLPGSPGEPEMLPPKVRRKPSIPEPVPAPPLPEAATNAAQPISFEYPVIRNP